MARHRLFVRTASVFLVAVALVNVPLVVYGQGVFKIDLEASAEQRNQLYTILNREVDELQRRVNILKTIVKLVSPTVVHIEARKSQSSSRVYGRSRAVEEEGSGVIVQMNENLYVLTNRHVIKDSRLEDIEIKLSNGRDLHPTKVWSDKNTDVAVMEMSAEKLVPARLGNSSTVEIGDYVLAVGSPFGLSHSVTYGIISAKGRRDLDLGDGGVRFQDFLQTDAAINPGNSGGPLINLRGELIGINTAIASNSGGNEGIGFSIPINMVMVIARQLVEKGSVKRAFLGVTLDSKFNSSTAVKLGLPRRQGARIIRITSESPAEAAQLQPDDVIVQFNGVRVDNDTHLVNIISLTEVGAEVPIVIFRDQQPQQLTVKVGDYNQFNPQNR